MAPLANSTSPQTPRTALLGAAFACLDRGGTVLTGNARAARALRHDYAAAQQFKAWQTPPIHDWQSWLASLWQQHLITAEDSPLLLTPLQEHAIWKQLLAEETNLTPAGVEPIAKLAARAYRLLSDYQLHADRNNSWPAGDSETFRQWAGLFDDQCRRKHWLPPAELPTLLARSISQNALSLPAELLLIGFDRLTPSQQHLLNTAAQTGTRYHHLDPDPVPLTQPQLIAAQDPAEELRLCAWWLRKTLEQAPHSRLAVLTQEIAATRVEIERTFRQVLMPSTLDIADTTPMPWEFSLGTSLAEVPVIQAALLLLRWLTEPLDQDQITWLLLSGFLTTSQAEESALPSLDAEIREHGKLQPEISLAAFANYHPRHSAPGAAAPRANLLARLRRLQIATASETGNQPRKTFPEWIVFARTALHEARWPGSRSLESLEVQARDSWDRLLEEVAKLSFDDRTVTYREFVTELDLNCRERIFAPESADAPIQIIGPSQSAGQTFDAIWFLGADETSWPPIGQPNPLLPLAIQRKAHMPHAAMEDDRQAALALTSRIAASALESIFSYTKQKDGSPLRPSSLLAELFGPALSALSAQEFSKKLNLPAKTSHPPQLENIEDITSVPWPTELVAGGSEILKRQAACPFQSFATRRLGAKKLASRERGLSAAERGEFLHKVLENLWSGVTEHQLKTRDDLLQAKSGGRLPQMLRHNIWLARNQLKLAGQNNPWMQAYLQVESDRLEALLLQWLHHEAAREPFTVIDHERRIEETSVWGLKLALRVDRIDEVAGGKLILDYKTGSVTPAQWRGPRPDEPQLPLYATYGGVDPLRGVLFAQIRAGKTELKGHAENVTETVANPESQRTALCREPLTEEMRGDWADALYLLAEEFIQGVAAVKPKKYPKTCEHCPLPALCRVAELHVAKEDDIEDETTPDEDNDG